MARLSMLAILVTLLAMLKPVLVDAADAISFGDETPEVPDEDKTVSSRASPLVAEILGVNPTGDPEDPESKGRRSPFNGQNSAFSAGRDNCCCLSASSRCPNPAFLGAINPRIKNKENTDDVITDSSLPDITTRIINNPVNKQEAQVRGCPRSQRMCCYSNVRTVESISNVCRRVSSNSQTSSSVFWRQGCVENLGSRSGRQCGERRFTPLPGRRQAESSPQEFPWTCLLLAGDSNRFIGTCAIVPNNRNNDMFRGTNKVITAAHKLANLRQNEELKVRVNEYDASGDKPSERVKQQDYTVESFKIHPAFDNIRLSNDIAVVYVRRRIRTSSPSRDANAACLPSCRDMFNYRFSNGTGVRCWVAGWGKDAENGQFQFVQHKVDVPIVDFNTCNNRLKQALGAKDFSLGRRFQLDEGEICAGGEEGKDACDGDGGSPLVCKSSSGHWHVVGLVAWGIGCGSPDVPGVYVNVHHYLDFIYT